MIAALLAGVAVIVAVILVLRRQDGPCDVGFFRQAGECVPSQEPVDKYARCIIRDAKQHVSSDTGATITAEVKKAKIGASTTVDLKDRFDKTVEASPDRCVLLDVSARCFALANGDKAAPPLPPGCAGTLGPGPESVVLDGAASPSNQATDAGSPLADAGKAASASPGRQQQAAKQPCLFAGARATCWRASGKSQDDLPGRLADKADERCRAYNVSHPVRVAADCEWRMDHGLDTRVDPLEGHELWCHCELLPDAGK